MKKRKNYSKKKRKHQKSKKKKGLQGTGLCTPETAQQKFFSERSVARNHAAIEAKKIEKSENKKNDPEGRSPPFMRLTGFPSMRVEGVVNCFNVPSK